MYRVSILCIQIFLPKIWEWGYGKVSSEMVVNVTVIEVPSIAFKWYTVYCVATVWRTDQVRRL